VLHVSISQRGMYCGDLFPSARELFGSSKCNWSAELPTDNSIIYFAHKARVGIKHICDTIKFNAGDEVLMPSYNCGAEVDPFIYSGARVVFYEINRKVQINAKNLINKITKKTRIVYVTHYFGFPQDLGPIKAICEKRNIFLFEDCALSLLSKASSRQIGRAGHFVVYNFPKFLPVPDGGVLVINRPANGLPSWRMSRAPARAVARKILPFFKRYFLYAVSGTFLFKTAWTVMRRTRNVAGRKESTALPEMPDTYYYDPRLDNTRISPVTRHLLERFEVSSIIRTRRENYIKYLELLKNVSGIKILHRELPDGVCPLCFPIFVGNRKHVCQFLNARSIEAVEWWEGYHRSCTWEEFPDARFLKESLLALPVHQMLSDKHIEYIAASLREAVGNC
jgi:perosamine synthetase